MTNDAMRMRFAGGDVQLAPDWPEEHPSGVTPTTLLDADDEDTEVMDRPDLLGADGVRS